VKEVRVKVGDKVSEGVAILTLEAAQAPRAKAGEARPPRRRRRRQSRAARSPRPPAAAPARLPRPRGACAARATRPAPPARHARAREPGRAPLRARARRRCRTRHGLGPEGPHPQGGHPEFREAGDRGRTPEPAAARGGGGSPICGLPAWPKVDFAKFGPVEAKPLSRIQKISGPALARNWVMIPHVTQFDEADITELEAFRAKVNEENAKAGIKVTPLAFLDQGGGRGAQEISHAQQLARRRQPRRQGYWNIGFAADTPNGLVVPVIKNADQKGVLEIAKESSELAAKARDGKLGPADMQGGTFSISSLGGIGGTAFTPIVNAPEVAILGVSKASMKPVWNGKDFAPRLMMPLSLSYDHRVVDGALGARFTAYLSQVIGDMRRSVL
jgi:pyruvate dehydrogenase E2 component (dihydrolipoamide acetyltransferase)